MSQPITIIAFYKFVTLNDFDQLKKPLLDFLVSNEIRGTILLAPEGINGTVSGSEDAINKLIARLREDSRLADLEFKFSKFDRRPFQKTKVKLKKEIISFGKQLSANQPVGTYVTAEEWNRLLDDENVVVIDTRNTYEIDVGTFPRAVNLKTESFRQLSEIDEHEFASNKEQKIAMFCTGGIRCEKYSAYLLERGFKNVYHLRGGILKYLEEIPDTENRWQGTCYVFDDRRSLKEHLEAIDDD
ncbi:MAG TPA: rhodanese-related sulfurtransferase [Oculatellaceae cyanobacterium]